MNYVDDPRRFPAAEAGVSRGLHELVERMLAAPTGDVGLAAETALATELTCLLDSGSGGRIAEAFEASPSIAVRRALWRMLSTVISRRSIDQLRLEPWVLPVVLVVGAGSQCDGPDTLPDAGRLVALLQQHRLLGGTRNVAVGDALIGASQLELPTLLGWLAPASIEVRAQALAASRLAPTPMRVPAGQEQAHLRFLVGSALVAPGVDAFAARSDNKASMAITRELASQFGHGALTVLPLAKLPMAPLPGVETGRAAQREVALQLFSGTVLRRIRTRSGEPTAIISAHRLHRDGELRVAFTSAFTDGPAEGFRYPLLATERVDDALRDLRQLLEQCRVADVRVLPAVFPDLDPQNGRLLWPDSGSEADPDQATPKLQ